MADKWLRLSTISHFLLKSSNTIMCSSGPDMCYSARQARLQCYDTMICARCGNCMNTRPRWTTLHPDNWTVLEVAEWVEHVAEEYKLGRQVKVKLASIFFDVDGRRLSAMTLRDFEDLDPENGNLLHTVFHNIVSDGRLDQLGEQPDEARTLTPINEVDSRYAVEHEEEDTSGDLAGHDTEGARGGQMSSFSSHGFPDLPNEQTTSRHPRLHQHQRPPPSS